jgi:hypothetical protein
MVGTFMLLFSLTVSAPGGTVGDEIINVYSKRFDTQIKCEEFLKNYEWLIRNKGVSAFQGMLKKGYSVKLNSVTCDTPTKAANVSNTITQNMGRG